VITYEDFGIKGVDPRGAVEQRVVCPQCTPRRKPEHRKEQDLCVNLKKDTWFCQHCLWKGSLAEKDSRKEEPVIMKPVKSEAIVLKGKTGRLYDWFNSRGISPEVVDRNGIGIRGKAKYWAIAFPMKIGNTVFNEKYRTLDKKFFHVTGGAQIFYKLNDIVMEDEAIITEGFEDALSFEMAGYRNAISVPSGAQNAKPGEAKLEYIDNSYPYIHHIKKFYIAVDNDTNGISLKNELIRRLGKRKCWLVNFPEGCKDANDVLLRHGADALKHCVEVAELVPIAGTYDIGVVDHELEKIYTEGFPEGKVCKLSYEFDELVSFHPGTLMVITGIPNAGKSPFMDHIIINLASEYGWKTAIYTPEHGFITLHAQRLFRQFIGKQYLPGYNNRMDVNEKDLAKVFVKDHIKYIYPDRGEFSMDNILDGAAYHIAKHGVKVLVIDPWNTILHEQKPNENETAYVGRMLNKLKYFAQEHGIFLALIAHPVKMQKKKDTGDYDIPKLYDISGSANWFNVPDIGVCVYRQYDNSGKRTLYTRVFVQKMKWEFMGSTGYCDFEFDVASQRFNKRERNVETFDVGID